MEKLSNKKKRQAVFLDRDGVINKEVGCIHKIDDFEFLAGVGSAIKDLNNSDFLAIVITNQSVIARNLCSIEELEKIHNKMETMLGREKARLDAIYYCPHHPDRGHPGENTEYKIECTCRKPKIGMIKKAEKEFNIDLNGSFFIGDSPRDILCGKNAGVTTIAVKTGHDMDMIVEPDYFFKNLPEAVNFIINS